MPESDLASLPYTLSSYDGDSEVLVAWLNLYKNHTLRAYQREVGSFLNFLSRQGIHSVRTVNVDHIKAYLEPLTVQKQDYATRVLNSFYRWMMEIGYIGANPIVPRSLAKLETRVRIDKFLNPNEIDYLTLAIDQLDGTLRNYATRRWIFWLLFYTGVRREEITGNTSKKDLIRYFGQKLPIGQRGPMIMSDFVYKLASVSISTYEGWELRVVGKGGRERNTPVSPKLMRELERYRAHLQLKDLLPSQIDTYPVVVAGNGHAMSYQGIYSNLKAITSAMADLLGDNPKCRALVDDLRNVTPDWFRYTYVISLLSAGTSLELVREVVGSTWLDKMFVHIERDEVAMREGVARLGRMVGI